MKHQRLRYFSLVLFLAFVFVQLPYSVLHSHDHGLECSLLRQKNKHPDATHLHQSADSHCFLCSAELHKDFAFTETAFGFFEFSPSEGDAPEYSFHPIISSAPSSPRAPPVFA